MPSYPIEPDKLLDAARILVPANPGRGRPSYTANRRAVSTSYYAVFHAISGRVVQQAFPTGDEAFQQGVRRWIAHTDVRKISNWVGQLVGNVGGPPPPNIAQLLNPSGTAPQVDADTVQIADGFIELNEKREQADYDHTAVFSRPDTLGLVQLAREVTDLTLRTQTDSALRFFGLIGFQARIQNR